MNKFFFTFFILAVMPNSLLAQKPVIKTLKGKISADASDLDGIYIINLKTEKAITTESGGYFSIPVTVGDTLMFSSIQFKGIRVAIKDCDLEKELLIVRMEPLMHQLDEVKVFQYKNINAVALGIIPKGQKSYTEAERKLRTATGLDAKIGLNTSLTIDPLLNLLSGRTAMLLKELEAEKKQILLQQIDYMFDREYFVSKLKIPAEYVKGFQYYIVENNRFAATLNAKNKAMATFLMGELATKYIEIIASEKK